jgi:hypothetical protein
MLSWLSFCWSALRMWQRFAWFLWVRCRQTETRQSVSFDNATVESALSPIHPAAGQLVTGLKRSDMFLPITGGLRVHGPDDLSAMAAIASSMRHAGFRPAEAMGRTFRIMAFVPGIADQDQLTTDVAGRKLGGAAATIVECFPSGAGKSAVRVGTKGHGNFPRDNSGQRGFFAGGWLQPCPGLLS